MYRNRPKRFVIVIFYEEIYCIVSCEVDVILFNYIMQSSIGSVQIMKKETCSFGALLGNASKRKLNSGVGGLRQQVITILDFLKPFRCHVFMFLFPSFLYVFYRSVWTSIWCALPVLPKKI